MDQLNNEIHENRYSMNIDDIPVSCVQVSSYLALRSSQRGGHSKGSVGIPITSTFMSYKPLQTETKTCHKDRLAEKL